MKKRSISLLPLLAASLALFPGGAGAQSALPPLGSYGCPALPSTVTSPFAFAIVGTSCVDLTQYIRATGTGTFSLATPQLTLGVGIVQVTATFDPDPFITFGATTTNLTEGPTTYAFLFGTPVVPGFYTTATSNGGITVTAGAGGSATVSNDGSIYPTYISGYGTNGALATNLGVDLGTADCVASGGPASTATCSQGSASNTFAPTFYDNLEALVTYSQTGIGSIVSFSGGVTLEAGGQSVVPEPATLMLLATGLSAIGGGGLARRRRRSASIDG